VNPRGARPIEHGYKAQDTCQAKEWPMCTDDDWVFIYYLSHTYRLKVSSSTEKCNKAQQRVS